jgi:hypothetical protein
LHHASGQETSCACAKLVGHNKGRAPIQATKQGYICLVKTTGIENIEYGSVIYCIECIFDVKIQNYGKISFPPSLMMQYAVELGQLTLGAPSSSKGFLCFVE